MYIQYTAYSTVFSCEIGTTSSDLPDMYTQSWRFAILMVEGISIRQNMSTYICYNQYPCGKLKAAQAGNLSSESTFILIRMFINSSCYCILFIEKIFTVLFIMGFVLLLLMQVM